MVGVELQLLGGWGRGTLIQLTNDNHHLPQIFQGLSPSLWGSLADQWGRRPVYLCTMVVYLGANIGLALAPNYPALLVLRMLQAFGSSSVIAIGKHNNVKSLACVFSLTMR